MIKASFTHTTKAFIIIMLINYLGQTHLCYAGSKKEIKIAYQAKNVSCTGNADGQITLDIKGAIAPVQIQWSNGASVKDLKNITAGNYMVTVTDSKGNLATQTINVTEPAAIEIHGEAFSENCSSKDAAIKVQLSGGTKPYTYSWSNGNTSKSLEGISAGDYALQVTDANGCIKTTNYNVERTRDLNVNVYSFNPLCADEATGLIDLEVKGGWLPYSFTWSNGATTEDVSGLKAGNYSVWVKDNNGCSSKLDMTLTGPEPIKIEATIKDADANKSNGNIALNVTGGAGKYTYIWSNMDEVASVNNLEEGIYAVRVTDANQCIAAEYYTVHEKSDMEIKGTVFNNLCTDDYSGMIDVTVSGGAKPYTYQWSTGDETANIKSLEAGLYLLIVTDANNKQVSKTFTVKEAEGMNVFATVKDESAFGKNDGRISLETIGGAAPYLVEWNTGAKQNVIGNLSAGMYSVTITDNNQCKTSHEVMVSTEMNVTETVSTSDKMMRIGKEVAKGTSPDIAVYPNPFDKSFTIRFATAISDIQKVEIFSTDGKLMELISSDAMKLDANRLTLSNISLAKGNYFVKVTTADKTYSKIVTKNL